MLTKTEINKRITSIRRDLQTAREWNQSVTGKHTVAKEMYDALGDVGYEARQLQRDLRTEMQMITFQDGMVRDVDHRS